MLSRNSDSGTGPRRSDRLPVRTWTDGDRPDQCSPRSCAALHGEGLSVSQVRSFPLPPRRERLQQQRNDDVADVSIFRFRDGFELLSDFFRDAHVRNRCVGHATVIQCSTMCVNPS